MAVDLHEVLPSGGEAMVASRVELALKAALARAITASTPPRLAAALRHSLFPGGGRLRPQLCLLVASSTSGVVPPEAEGAAAAIELLHCASLVHDDLPCFDDADLRRGQPSVHKAFGEPLAVLAGDALIVQAFAEVAQGRHAGALVRALADAAGAARGIVAGQAWESEPVAPVLDEYHRAKTASLFEAAAVLGAIHADAPVEPWRAFGEALGRAYQAADDVVDAAGDAVAAGKPCGRDEELARPSLVRLTGLDAARTRAGVLFHAAVGALPPGNPRIEAWARRLAARVLG